VYDWKKFCFNFLGMFSAFLMSVWVEYKRLLKLFDILDFAPVSLLLQPHQREARQSQLEACSSEAKHQASQAQR